ncbi:MAG: hypothetical protein J7L34_01535 [Thermotogaceae bacterium]|nr:hypothetical protein [Thermotogaceae bacterium]
MLKPKNIAKFLNRANYYELREVVALLKEETVKDLLVMLLDLCDEDTYNEVLEMFELIEMDEACDVCKEIMGG